MGKLGQEGLLSLDCDQERHAPLDRLQSEAS